MVATRRTIAKQSAAPRGRADAARRQAETLAGIGHELRTPMHAILSYARLGEAKAGRLPAERLRHYFTSIRSSGERLLALVNDLMDLSRMEAGGMRYRFGRHELAPVAREVAQEMEQLAEARGVALAVLPSADDTSAWCDPLRARQVLRNLLDNAIRFSPPETTVRVAFADALLPAGRRAGDVGTIPALAVAVRDSGHGIPERERETIFEKFVQGSVGDVAGGGAGLGLAICREIVNAHGGHIWAGNHPEGGAVLTFALPRSATPATRRRAHNWEGKA